MRPQGRAHALERIRDDRAPATASATRPSTGGRPSWSPPWSPSATWTRPRTCWTRPGPRSTAGSAPTASAPSSTGPRRSCSAPAATSTTRSILLDRSEKVCRGLGMRVDVGRALLVRAHLERRRRRAAAARAALEPAESTVRQRSAPCRGWPGRRRGRPAAAAPRRPARRLLTETEARVAAEVARGASNREIAERLYLSVKTVEATLTRIYRKLEVRSRTQLAARWLVSAERPRVAQGFSPYHRRGGRLLPRVPGSAAPALACHRREHSPQGAPLMKFPERCSERLWWPPVAGALAVGTQVPVVHPAGFSQHPAPDRPRRLQGPIRRRRLRRRTTSASTVRSSRPPPGRVHPRRRHSRATPAPTTSPTSAPTAACRSSVATSWSPSTTTARSPAGPSARSARSTSASVRPTVSAAAATASATREVAKVSTVDRAEARRLRRRARRAWPGRPSSPAARPGSPTKLTVYTDARSGQAHPQPGTSSSTAPAPATTTARSPSAPPAAGRPSR